MSPSLRRAVGGLVVATSLATPALASADVGIGVPRAFLGGRVIPGQPAASVPSPAASQEVTPDGVDPMAPDLWDLAWPASGDALAVPDLQDRCGDGDVPAEDCILTGDDAVGVGPGPGLGVVVQDPNAAASAPAVTSPSAPAGTSTVDQAALLSPAFGSWLVSQTPRLSWRPTPGARYYNIQAFLGPRRVLSAWTRGPSLRVPRHAIDQGRYYMWSVWPGFGSRRAKTYGPPLGRSIFGVILRPRIVFHPLRGAHGRAVWGEVRPHIPGGVLALGNRHGVREVPIDTRGRVQLRMSLAAAAHLWARLVERGSDPPQGLRAGL